MLLLPPAVTGKHGYAGNWQAIENDDPRKTTYLLREILCAFSMEITGYIWICVLQNLLFYLNNMIAISFPRDILKMLVSEVISLHYLVSEIARSLLRVDLWRRQGNLILGACACIIIIERYIHWNNPRSDFEFVKKQHRFLIISKLLFLLMPPSGCIGLHHQLRYFWTKVKHSTIF